MNKTFITAISKFCIFSMLACQPALAFNQAGDVTLTAGGGYDIFSSKRHIQNAGIPVGIIGYNFTDNWGIEGLLGFFHADSIAPAIYGKQINGTMFAANVVYHFSPYSFIQPYVLAGPGAMDLNPNGTSAHAEGNINAAVGAQLFMTEVVAFRVEARDLYTFVGGKNDVFLSGGVTVLIAT